MDSVCLEGGRTPDMLIKDRAERNIKALKKSTGGKNGMFSWTAMGERLPVIVCNERKEIRTE